MSTSCMVGAVGIEIASLTHKSKKGNGVAPPPHSNWCQLVPTVTELACGILRLQTQSNKLLANFRAVEYLNERNDAVSMPSAGSNSRVS